MTFEHYFIKFIAEIADTEVPDWYITAQFMYIRRAWRIGMTVERTSGVVMEFYEDFLASKSNSDVSQV